MFLIGRRPPPRVLGGRGWGGSGLWSMASGKLLATLTRPNAGGAPYGIAFSPDSRFLAVGEGAYQTDLWDVTGNVYVRVTSQLAS